MQKKTRVLLADGHRLMRSGLRLVIERHPDFTVVGEADDGRQAVAMAESLKPDVIVMDIGMPNLNGIEAARHDVDARRPPDPDRHDNFRHPDLPRDQRADFREGFRRGYHMYYDRHANGG